MPKQINQIIISYSSSYAHCPMQAIKNYLWLKYSEAPTISTNKDL